jgi:hypothetical protein
LPSRGLFSKRWLLAVGRLGCFCRQELKQFSERVFFGCAQVLDQRDGDYVGDWFSDSSLFGLFLMLDC